LRVRTLGGFAVWRDETLVPRERWTSRRATALFKCLLGAPGQRLQREQAIELLWPEAEPATGATNLRTTLHVLRKLLDGPPGTESSLRTDGELLVLAPADGAAHWLDATAFAQAADLALAGRSVAACRGAVRLYGGEYLPDDRYEVWATAPREALQRRYEALLLHQALLSGEEGELAEAERCLGLLLAVDPCHEEAAGRLMGLLAASGRATEALRVYQVLAAALEDDLGLAPAADLQALRARLVASEIVARPATQPPRAAHPARPTNLPSGLTSFVGRVWERQAVGDALAQAHLVTLTGSGGCGKTRLALEVAGGLVAAYPDGVWLVELAALADAGLVVAVVARALGVVEQPGQPLLTTLGAFLQPRTLLLVLDNCEHLVGACAALAEALVRRCPTLWVLATSREALGVPGEIPYRVPSLSVPNPAQPPAPDALPAYEAVQLFLQRAQARRPEFQLTAQNAGAVTAVCARLDGLPLAIELAAARMSVLSVEAIAAWLDDQFRLLTGGPRTALPRQQTLQATLDWSYDLLSAPERVLLRRLAVFAGGWTLAGAEAVGGGPGVERWEVLDGLVAKSLVQAEEEADAGMRYGLLETVRQYGRERLLAAGETVLMHRRHAAYYLALVERAEPAFNGPDQLRWLDRLEREHANLRAALAWCLGRREQSLAVGSAQAVETGLRLAGSLNFFWLFRDHSAEGLAWLDQALAGGAAAPAAVRAQALLCAAVQATRGNDPARALALLTESVALHRGVGDRRWLSRALGVLGSTTALCGQEEQAAAILEESVALARAVGEPWLIGHALLHGLFRVGNSVAIARAEERTRAMAAGAEGLQLFQVAGDRMCVAVVQIYLGQIALYDGDYERARAAFVACLPLLRELGWRSNLAYGLVRLAEIARAQGDHAQAAAYYAEGLALFRDEGDQGLPAVAWVLSGRAVLALEQGEWTLAQAHLAESLAIARDTGHVGAPERAPELAGVLEVGAALAALHGAPARAMRLAGAAVALRAHLNRPLAPSEQAALERRLAPARRALSTEEQATAWAAGQAMSAEQAIAYALAGLPPAHSTSLRLE
jgi:predicted ATPase/DNA-binding SARP family transcriptional activator